MFSESKQAAAPNNVDQAQKAAVWPRPHMNCNARLLLFVHLKIERSKGVGKVRWEETSRASACPLPGTEKTPADKAG